MKPAPKSSAVHKKVLKTPLRIEFDDKEIFIAGRWKKAIQTAKERAGYLAKNNIGKAINVFEKGNPEPIWTARMIYSETDPIWKVTPSIQDCREIFCAVVLRVLYDARVIDPPVHGAQWQPMAQSTVYTEHSIKQAKNYIMGSKNFAEVCDLAGLDVSAVRKVVKGKT